MLSEPSCDRPASTVIEFTERSVKAMFACLGEFNPTSEEMLACLTDSAALIIAKAGISAPQCMILAQLNVIEAACKYVSVKIWTNRAVMKNIPISEQVMNNTA